ncbi:MAG: hypothetical protein Q4D98_02410 [Planctomycetia bacterium]|nr:hypothetical protein [Planctomycetia bacterium]
MKLLLLTAEELEILSETDWKALSLGEIRDLFRLSIEQYVELGDTELEELSNRRYLFMPWIYGGQGGIQMLKNTDCTVYYSAWDGLTGMAKTGDVAHHTCRFVRDGGTLTVCANPPSEVGNGVYQIALTAAETDGSMLTLVVTSATENVVCPAVSFTFDDVERYKSVPPTVAEIAQGVLNGDVSQVEASAPTFSLATVILAQLQSRLEGNAWIIYHTDGTTPHVTRTVVPSEVAFPVVEVRNHE